MRLNPFFLSKDRKSDLGYFTSIFLKFHSPFRICSSITCIMCLLHLLLSEGMKLYVSDNKVILTEGFDGVVPVKFFEKIESWPGREPIPFKCLWSQLHGMNDCIIVTIHSWLISSILSYSSNFDNPPLISLELYGDGFFKNRPHYSIFSVTHLLNPWLQIVSQFIRRTPIDHKFPQIIPLMSHFAAYSVLGSRSTHAIEEWHWPPYIWLPQWWEFVKASFVDLKVAAWLGVQALLQWESDASEKVQWNKSTVDMTPTWP